MNQEEKRLRSLVRKGINVILERKEQQKNEEKRLRNIVRHLISEIKGSTKVADTVVHKNTGINSLDTLLRNIINQIESGYKNLSSNELQRKSFRYHFLVNFKNLLAPINANREAPEGQLALAEQEDKPEVEISIDDKLEDDDINAPPDPDKFIPVRPQDEEKAKEDQEKEEGFIKVETENEDIKQGGEFAEEYLGQVQSQIIKSYEKLIVPTDAGAFEDWALTNLKLYFDKFDDEMADKLGTEPESPGYPPKGEPAPLEEVYEI